MRHQDEPSWDSAYQSDLYRWWHLSRQSPELMSAVGDGWIGGGTTVLDLGCGLGSELGWLTEEGLSSLAVGVDRSRAALSTMNALHPRTAGICADVTTLPFAAQSFDVVLDRGCFHYLTPEERHRYGREVARVLRPGGRMLLRACLTSAGVRNDIDEAGVRAALSDLRVTSVENVELPSDTRTMAALLVRAQCSTPAPDGRRRPTHSRLELTLAASEALLGVALRPASSRSDADLVACARTGDKAALAALIGRHRPMVLALCRRLLRNDTLAADAVQEATLAALTALGRLRSPERFGAWYAGIALNLGRRWLREPTVTDRLLEIPDEQPSPEEHVEIAETAARVRQAVSALPSGQREAVLAFYWKGLTHAEAANELGASPGAVKARLHQARASLAPQLASHLLLERKVRSMTTTSQPFWVDVDVIEIRRASDDDPARRRHVIILEEASGGRRLPIYTGPTEAVALACTMESVDMPRPMTYQMAASLVTAAGAEVVEVRITVLAESTFYAVAVIRGPAGLTEVDARPSDALNLALVAGAPIRVDAALLDDPDATRRTAWEAFPTRGSELAAEVRHERDEMLASLAEEQCLPG